MLALSSTKLASTYYKVRVGGDAAMLKGVMKILLSMHEQALANGEPGVIDEVFIRQHTQGFAELKADLDATDWDHILKVSGMEREEIQNIARLYADSERTIICYGMGITQHQYGTQNVQQIANLLLLRGNIGKKGAGICHCAATPMCRATAPLASLKFPLPSFSITSNGCLVLNHRVSMGTARWLPFRRCATAK